MHAQHSLLCDHTAFTSLHCNEAAQHLNDEVAPRLVTVLRLHCDECAYCDDCDDCTVITVIAYMNDEVAPHLVYSTEATL